MRRLAALLVSIGFIAVACAPAPAPTPVDCNATPKPYVNLQGCNLSGRDFSGANLYGARMQRADLTNAVFHGADLSYATLSNAKLSGAEFGADWETDPNPPQANLTGTDMSNSTGISLSYVDAVDMNLSGATVVGSSNAWISNTNFSHVILRNQWVVQSGLEGNFTGADLTGIYVWKGGISGNFTGANLTNAYFDWNDAYFSGDLTNANLTGSNITGEYLDVIWSNTTCPNGVIQSTPCL